MSNLGSANNPPSRLFIGDGNVNAPSITFGADTDTGIYRSTTNELSIATNSTQRFRFTASGSMEAVGGADIKIGDGTAANPAFTFASDPDSGWYRSGSNQISYSSGGLQVLNISSGFVDLTAHLGLTTASGTAAGPIISHRNNQDSGLYWPTTASIAFSVDTVPTITLRADNSVDMGIYLNRGYLKFGTGAGNGGDGTAANPIFTWESDIDTGIYRQAANTLSISTGGVEKARFDGNLTLLSGSLIINTSGEVIRAQDGTAASPSYQFVNDTDTGFYRPAGNSVAVATSGRQSARFQTNNGANETDFHLYDVSAGTVVAVTRGAADSGGAGFRLLRIPN